MKIVIAVRHVFVEHCTQLDGQLGFGAAHNTSVHRMG
jgi:hypothetical protein